METRFCQFVKCIPPLLTLGQSTQSLAPFKKTRIFRPPYYIHGRLLMARATINFFKRITCTQYRFLSDVHLLILEKDLSVPLHE